ncbi:MAG TPA: DnaB-like helicase N-terminal domain-containing protein, partial [Gemmatimonadaceae bacterium]|nr:DnaB-like helicase N-terminal domain-containing protein [Gemmatimonadaceae bacterium]
MTPSLRLTREPKAPKLYSEEAEQAVISAMLVEQSAITRTRELLTGESFYRSAHGRLFDAIVSLADRGEIVDPLTLMVSLEASNSLESVGGRKYLAYLIDVVPSASNVEYHARIVRDFAERRSLIQIAETLAKSAADGTVAVQDTAQVASSALLPAAASLSKGGFVHIRDLIFDVANDIEAASQGMATGYQFGFRDIDIATGGALPGEVVFVCSVPGACKTALTLNMGLAAAERGEGVAYFSAEMKDKALVKRLVSNRAQVNGYSIRTGRIQDGEFVRLGAALGALGQLPFWVDDTPEPDIALMKARARALKA